MFRDSKGRLTAFIIIIVALVAVPVPLLPPHTLAGSLQTILGTGWPASYLAAAVLLQVLFYGSLGLLAAIVVKRAKSPRALVAQILLVPIALVAVALVIRSLKAGHLPIWINAAVPIAACIGGTGLGLGLLHRYWRATPAISIIIVAGTLWLFLGGTSTTLRADVEARLRNIAAVGPSLPTGDARFGALLQLAFEPAPTSSVNALEQNRAAILAWGITVGTPRLARLVGIDPNSETVKRAIAVGEGTTLLGRSDWPKHYALSAALAVIEHPIISDAGGLMKEQLDALTHGSGFSFGDLAADRAGVRLAKVAAESEASAKSTQKRIKQSFVLTDFFPAKNVFSENLTVEQFRDQFGGVGTQRYRDEVQRIEAELDSCSALAH